MNFISLNDKILHLGACDGQELNIYSQYGASKVVFVEANPDLIPIIHSRCNSSNLETHVYNKAIYNKSGEQVNFHIIYSDDMTNMGCSSLLELGKHADYYPFIKKKKTIQCETITIDDILKDHDFNFDILYMDLQGAELLALEGCSRWDFKYIYTEVLLEELYVGCALFPDVKNFLEAKGYKHINTQLQHPTWGDALFEKV